MCYYFKGILDESPRRSLQQVVASTAQARWLNSAAMGTYAGSANSRAMVQTGVNIHQVISLYRNSDINAYNFAMREQRGDV